MARLRARARPRVRIRARLRVRVRVRVADDDLELLGVLLSIIHQYVHRVGHDRQDGSKHCEREQQRDDRRRCAGKLQAASIGEAVLQASVAARHANARHRLGEQRPAATSQWPICEHIDDGL